MYHSIVYYMNTRIYHVYGMNLGKVTDHVFDYVHKAFGIRNVSIDVVPNYIDNEYESKYIVNMR